MICSFSGGGWSEIQEGASLAQMFVPPGQHCQSSKCLDRQGNSTGKGAQSSTGQLFRSTTVYFWQLFHSCTLLI
jgi:hypothetical protein